jgi:hypothetical protein
MMTDDIEFLLKTDTIDKKEKRNNNIDLPMTHEIQIE